MLHVCCSNCSSHLGLFDVSNASVILYKWQVDCQTRSPCRLPTSTDCLAATLLATLSRSGSSQSVIIPTRASESEPSRFLALNIWIFNGHIVYSSTEREGKPRPALKVLYKRLSQEEADRMLDSFTSTAQEVSFQAEAIQAAADALEPTNLFLPPKERFIKDWQVCLLDKWTK